MLCTRCQGQNADNVNFCGHCGAPLRATCPNCGTVNAAGAKFCTNCGHAIGAVHPAPMASPQPVMVVKQGTSGWVWALAGILIAAIVIGGLGLGGILPMNFVQKATSTPTLMPALQPVIASTKTPEVLASVELYCPQEGGVILYWNAGYDCTSESGDPGYRYRVGDGAQNLNTGEFDNQASALYIPTGWSVQLYENTDQSGGSVCLNSPVPNFETRGNFPDKAIPINDNVSSMEVFADGTCGEDLAAGAEPAPWPKNQKRIKPPGAGNPADVGAADVPCYPGGYCDCVPPSLVDIMLPPDDEGWIPPIILEDLFQEKYIDSIDKSSNSTVVTFKPEFNELLKELKEFDMEVYIDAFDWGESEPCAIDYEATVPLSCEYPYDMRDKDKWEEWNVAIFHHSPTGSEKCAEATYGSHGDDNIFELGEPQPALQCTNPNKPQACGNQCCRKNEQCVQGKGEWKCGSPDKPSEPKQCDPSDSCCLDPSLSGCP